MKKQSNFPAPKHGCRGGFTLIELLVVIAIIAILAAMLLPALNMAKQQSQGTYCISNLKQMTLAWSMYPPDFHDYTPGNFWTGEQADNNNTNWLSGWEEIADPNTSDNTNTALFTSGNYSSLAPYWGGNPKIFQCCAAKSLCLEGSSSVLLCRDVSMNVFMGYASIPNAQDTNNGFQMFKKSSQIGGHTPNSEFVFGPSAAMVFIDEKNMSVDDGEFLIEETQNSQMANIPAAYHAGAGCVSFADGHAELHKWTTAILTQANYQQWPLQFGGVVPSSTPKENFVNITTPPALPNADLLWLQDHMSYSTTAGLLPGNPP